MLAAQQFGHVRQILTTSETLMDFVSFLNQNSSRLLLLSRSFVREASTSSVGRLPSCLPPLLLTFTVALSLSLSPTTGQKDKKMKCHNHNLLWETLKQPLRILWTGPNTMISAHHSFDQIIPLYQICSCTGPAVQSESSCLRWPPGRRWHQPWSRLHGAAGPP